MKLRNWIPLLLCVTLSATGCMSGSGAKKFLKEGRRAHEAQDYTNAVAKYEQALTADPYILTKERRKEDADAYADSQIHHGNQMAEKAIAENRPIDAWIWYVQVSNVDSQREECKAAAQKAEEMHGRVGESLLADARQAEASGDFARARELQIQATWYGINLEKVPASAEPPSTPPPAPGANGVVVASQTVDSQPVALDTVNKFYLPPVGPRTDLMAVLSEDGAKSPYGIPIYYGEPPRYYTVIGVTQTKIKAVDPLLAMSKKAQKHGADGLVDVKLYTRSQKQYMEAKMVKFVK